MEDFYKRWDTPRCRFGDLAVLGFLVVQCLDGTLTYLGIAIWGPGIEANPIVSSAVAFAWVGTALTATKLLAICCGIALHLGRVHNLVALLTLMYVAIAILPWTAMFLATGP